ncbi:hypothetical protein ACFWN7_06145 [Agromyces sp. NPDC058484]|uniref:hypothetical protein n=1 Tax=Agromyces sp. NPDC058484 TaxID=3346524 RepID=UPI003661EA3C
MLVLHAFWVPGEGAGVWAEDSDLAVTSPSQALRRARPHPFAVPAGTLSTLVGGTASTSTLLLPSLRRSPLDSPELFRISPRQHNGSAPSALEWTVPVTLLDLAGAGDALARFADPSGATTDDDNAASDDPVRDADVRPAASVRHLAELFRYAEELVDRGRVLPTLAGDEHGANAHWRVVLTGPDAAAASALIADMPPALRAASPSQSPAALATGALDAITDALVRRRLPTSFLPRRRGRRPARLPAIEAWLDALTGPAPPFGPEARASDADTGDDQPDTEHHRRDSVGRIERCRRGRRVHGIRQWDGPQLARGEQRHAGEGDPGADPAWNHASRG